ncbi:hypothetical protein CR513_07088, partial [Mucuna pruriens]
MGSGRPQRLLPTKFEASKAEVLFEITLIKGSIRLFIRVMAFKRLILHILFGIWPEKLFDRSRRILKFKRLSPTHAGIVPERLFSPRSKHINWSVFFKMVGNIPESELLRICKDCSPAKEAMDGGKFPTKWLLCKFTSIRNDQIIQQSGISPNKLFDARLRNSKFIGLSCFLHRKSSMDSKNELLERSNQCTSFERY